jgi:hypothetical protein
VTTLNIDSLGAQPVKKADGVVGCRLPGIFWRGSYTPCGTTARQFVCLVERARLRFAATSE